MSALNLRNAFKINRHKLDNGLDVILIANNKVPIVCVNIAYRVGSKDERFDRTGMAHLFEHLMFEGTANVPKGEFDRLCSLAGGSNNAFTSFDLTNYYMSLPSNQLDMGLWLEADRMKNFEITPEALKNQQDVVIEEISQTVEDQPYGLWRELMSATAYSPESSYSWEVHGKKEHVSAVTLEDAEIFRKMYYQPENACLLVVGDIDTNDALNKINKYFSGIEKFNNAINRNLFNDNQLLHSGYDKFEDDVPTSAVFVSFHTKGFNDEANHITDILSNIIGLGRSSRLYKKLVNEEQIASSAGAFVDKREKDSLLTFYAFANSENINPDKLKESLYSVFTEFIKNDISENEIEKAQNQLATQLAFEVQTFTGLAEEVAHFAIFNDAPEKIYSINDSYKKFGKRDIKELADNLFSNGKGIVIDAIPSSGQK